MDKTYKDFVVYEKDEKNKNNAYGNNNFKNNQHQNSVLELNDAIAMSSYPQYIQDFIKTFLIDNYSNNDIAQVFLVADKEERIFVIEYVLGIEFNNKNYNVYVLVYLPILYPNYPPEFYIERNAKIGLNNYYKNGKINETDLKINLDCFGKFDPTKNNIAELIDNLLISFSQEFPVFKSNPQQANSNNNNYKCFLDKSKANKIILPKKPKNNYNNNNMNIEDYKKFENVKTEKIIEEKHNKPFDDKAFLEFIRNQTKDIIHYNYLEYKEKYHINNNLEELKNINSSSNKYSDDILNLYQKNEQLKKQIDNLKYIKNKLQEIENIKLQELQDIDNTQQKNFFEKYKNIIEVEDQQYMEYIIKIKVLEDYLAYLKKGYEKDIISFENMLKLNRAISREIFNLIYVKDKIHNKI